MTLLQLTASPLIVPPYLKLLRQTYVGDPGIEQYVYPKLAKAPSKMKPTESLDKLALVTDLRTADVPDAIGNSLEGTATTGVRAISHGDRFIFLGGNATTKAKLYERAGPLFVNINLPEFLDHDYVISACFSNDDKYLFCIFHDLPYTVEVFYWNGGDAEDVLGGWSLIDPISLVANTGTDVRISPTGKYLIANATAKCFIVDLETSLDPLAATGETGVILAVNHAEDEWLYSINNTTDVKVATMAAGLFTQIDTLPSSAGAKNKAAYSPDDLVVVVAGRPQTGVESPRMYFKNVSTGLYVYSRGIVHSNTSSWNTGDIMFKSDAQFALASAEASGSRVEVYKRDVITPEPYTPDGSLGSNVANGNDAVRSGDGYFIATRNGVYHWNGTSFDDVTPTGYTTTVSPNPSGASFSFDGTYLMATSVGTGGVFWKWNGSSYDSKAACLAGGNSRSCAISYNGLKAAICLSAGGVGTIKFADYNAGANSWAADGSTLTFAASGAGANCRARFCPGRDDLIVVASLGTLPVVFKRVSGTWTLQSALPFTSGYNYGFTMGWHPSGDYLAVGVRNAAGNWRVNVFHRGSGDAFTLAYDSGTLATSTSVNIVSVTYAPDGRALIVAYQAAATPYFLYQVDDGGLTYTTRTLPSAPTTASTGAVFSVKHLIWFSGSVSPKWIYDMSGEMQSYAIDTTLALTGTVLKPASYNFGSTAIHYGDEGDAHSVLSASPWTPLTSLSFAPGKAVSDVFDVLHSYTGKVVLYHTPSGVFVSTRPNSGSDFISSDDLERTFVEVYDRSGNVYKERNYSVYEYGTPVYDFDFSPNEEVISYHVENLPDAPIDQPQGRLIYDISGAGSSQNFEFRGAVWEADMTNSYIRFSPFNTHFVVIHEHAITHDPFISLHEFTDSSYDYANQDTKPVEFGPADWSVCSDIVVAHGGANPLTFFHHDDTANILIPLTIDIGGWTNGDDPIADIAWSPDCDNLIVLLPDKLQPLTHDPDDPDPDSKTPDDPTPLDPPIDYDPHDHHHRPRIRWHPDDDVDVDPDGDGDPKRPPKRHHHYDPLTHTVDDISYVPYVVQTVTFRVYSVPVEVP